MGKAAKVLFLVVAVALTIYALIRLYEFPDTSTLLQTSNEATAAIPGLANSYFSIQTNKSVVGSEEKLTTRLLLHNGPGGVLSGVRITSESEPGFEYRLIPMGETSVPKNGTTEGTSVNLVPSTTRGRFRLTINYSLLDGKKIVHEGQISSRSIEIRDAVMRKRELFLKRLFGLLKDLTLPIVVVGLGYWFQRRQAQRDSVLREKTEEESRRQDIWKTILPQFYALSEDHYLPIVRSLRNVERFSKAVPSVGQNPPPTGGKSSDPIGPVERLLYEYLVLIFRMDLLRRKRGQLFFRHRGGEQVASVAWKIFVLGSERELDRPVMDGSIEKMKKGTTFKEFCAVIADPAYAEMRSKFWVWVHNPDTTKNFHAFTGLAKILQEVLFYEANVPFDDGWYESAAVLTLDKSDKYSYPSGIECDQDVKELKELIDKYIKTRNLSKEP